jgi:hypothetical protein
VPERLRLRVLGPAWVQSSGKRTARGAVIWHAADGPRPHSSYLTPKDAAALLRHLLEHDAVRRATPRTTSGSPVTFADAARPGTNTGSASATSSAPR